MPLSAEDCVLPPLIERLSELASFQNVSSQKKACCTIHTRELDTRGPGCACAVAIDAMGRADPSSIQIGSFASELLTDSEVIREAEAEVAPERDPLATGARTG